MRALNATPLLAALLVLGEGACLRSSEQPVAAPQPAPTRCCEAPDVARARRAASVEALRLCREFLARRGEQAARCVVAPLSDSSLVGRARCSLHFVVGLSTPSDTAAEVEVDACTAAVLTSKLTGGF